MPLDIQTEVVVGGEARAKARVDLNYFISSYCSKYQAGELDKQTNNSSQVTLYGLPFSNKILSHSFMFNIQLSVSMIPFQDIT